MHLIGATDIKAKKSFLLRLEEKMFRQLHALADEKNMNLSKLIREVLQDYLDGTSAPKPKLERKDQWWMS